MCIIKCWICGHCSMHIQFPVFGEGEEWDVRCEIL